MSRIDALQRALAIDPDDPFVLYGLAQEHAKAGDYSAAVAWYDRCLAADPAYCYAYFHKAKAQEAAGDAAAARTTLRAGLAAAQKAGDGKARGEIAEYLESLDP